jgi:hypothetical protein
LLGDKLINLMGISLRRKCNRPSQLLSTAFLLFFWRSEFSRSSFYIFQNASCVAIEKAPLRVQKEASSGTRQQMAESSAHNEMMLRAWDEGKRALHCVFWLALFARARSRGF